jgi:inhibitor of KinA
MIGAMSGPGPGSDAPRATHREPEIRPASDRALLVSFDDRAPSSEHASSGDRSSAGDRIGQGAHQEVLRLLSLLDAEPLAGVVDLSPAYASILVRFDPRLTDHDLIAGHVLRLLRRIGSVAPPAARVVEIPVCYGGEFGPDLEDVAQFAALSREETIALHAGRTYDVFFLGFSPGFAYLGVVPDAIACPRLARPRRQVPAGSVGIAGGQTGVYPHPTPGGWRIVGRTPLLMFDAGSTPMSRLQIGDQVRFVPIEPGRYWEMQR